jgi:hypothetical protein
MDEQTHACKRLLSAVVSTAMLDTMYVPVKTPSGLQLRPDTVTAFEFLFDDKNPYLEVLDINQKNFQASLLRKMYSEEINSTFTSIQKRAFRMNYKLWQQEVAKMRVYEQNDIHAF